MSDSDELAASDMEEQSLRFALHDAAERGDAASLRAMLYLPADGEAAPQVNPLVKILFGAKDFHYCNPLHVAILYGQVDCARELLAAGINPNARCDGCPPLHMAVNSAMHQGRREAALQITQLLLKYQAQSTDVDDGGRTALHWAAAVGLAEAVAPITQAAAAEREAQLTQYQAAAAALGDELPTNIDHLVDVKDNDGNTALGLAARHGHADTITALLQPGTPWDPVAMCKARNKDHNMPIHLAAKHNHLAAVQALLTTARTASLKAQDKRGRTALQVAQSRGHQALARYLESQSQSQSQIPSSPPSKASTVKSEPAPKPDPQSPPPAPQHQQPAPSVRSSAPVCKLIAPEECFLHRTAPDYRRGASPPPPENTSRLKVLTDSGFGILRGDEFSSLPWQTQGVQPAAMSDVLRCHEWAYIRHLGAECLKIQDSPDAFGHLDGDTAICHQSYLAALKAAGACCQAVDDVMKGQAQSVFCVVRPPGHHAGPMGVVKSPNNPDAPATHGFCLLSNIAIAAGYAMTTYRHQGIKRVAILDFDVHHGNGTEAVVANVVPSMKKVPLHTPFAEGYQLVPQYKPWLDTTDKDNILFASVQGYGKFHNGTSWFYPGSGATSDTRPAPAAPTAHSATPAQAPVAPDVEMTDAGGPGPVAAGASGALGAGVFPEDPDGEFVGSTSDKGGEGSHHDCPRIINVGVPGPGAKRQLWRRAWRDKILPAVANFKPDMIFISAGFDAHKKDLMNTKFVGIVEADYEWLTDQIKQLANRFCQGRIVSALEGGYNLFGGYCSALARSVASHVRVLAEPHVQQWDPDESKEEREAEARKREAAAAMAAAQEAAATAMIAQTAAHQVEAAAATGQEGEVLGRGVRRSRPTDTTAPAADSAPAAQVAGEATGGADPMPAAAEATAQAQAGTSQAAVVAAEGGGRPKRQRRGNAVDYVALNAKLEAEKRAAADAAAAPAKPPDAQ